MAGNYFQLVVFQAVPLLYDEPADAPLRHPHPVDRGPGGPSVAYDQNLPDD